MAAAGHDRYAVEKQQRRDNEQLGYSGTNGGRGRPVYFEWRGKKMEIAPGKKQLGKEKAANFFVFLSFHLRDTNGRIKV